MARILIHTLLGVIQWRRRFWTHRVIYWRTNQRPIELWKGNNFDRSRLCAQISFVSAPNVYENNKNYFWCAALVYSVSRAADARFNLSSILRFNYGARRQTVTIATQHFFQ